MKHRLFTRLRLAWMAFKSFDDPLVVEPVGVCGGWRGARKLIVSVDHRGAILRLDLSVDCARFLSQALPDWSGRVFHPGFTMVQAPRSSEIPNFEGSQIEGQSQ